MIFRSNRSIGKLTRVSSRTVGAAHQARRGKRRKVFGIMRKLLVIGITLGLISAVGIGILMFNIARKLPDVHTISTYIPAETTKIYSADGIILAELHREENRILIPIERISPTLQNTVIAMEDTDFYKHTGINLKGMMRALYKDILARSFVQGGSTLTQQLARNLFLHKQKKIIRKIAEIILAIQIEREYTKTEILEMYLNQVYWGHNAYGIESASQMYFGKHANELTLAQSAGLVGMLKGPELFSPFRNMGRYKRRQRVVLNRMTTLGILSQSENDISFTEETVLATRKKHKYKAPYFTSYVVKQLIEMYGEESTYTSGMKVTTTLDYALQQHADKVVKKYVELGNKPYWIKGERVSSLNYTEGALLAVDPRTGYIKAMQGGVDFGKTQFNRTVQAKRQPGSAFKPFVYLAALDKGLSPGTFLDDSPVTFNTIEGPYSPKNYNLKYSGKIPMRKALERSINVIAVKLNDLVGPKRVVEVAHQMGIESDLKPVLSLPLGANEVTMLELVQSYMAIANNGISIKPTSILKIEDRDGVPLFKHEIRERKVFDGNTIAALVDMMTGVVNYGTGRNAKLPRPMAGKTGTTSDYKDAWFFGFVPQIVCATWVGNDDNTPMINVTGGWMPAAMWKDFMKTALREVKPQAFTRPRGVVQRRVNWETGLLASSATPKDAKITTEKYWKGKEPTRRDTVKTIKSVQQSRLIKKKQEALMKDFFDL
ncbi:PBP1A family penicillin-binding protein [bacterium]|jgi:penicillin-binding protein 1A|nr:PBP1A family penicillin-binding protein [bacterium]